MPTTKLRQIGSSVEAEELSGPLKGKVSCWHVIHPGYLDMGQIRKGSVQIRAVIGNTDRISTPFVGVVDIFLRINSRVEGVRYVFLPLDSLLERVPLLGLLLACLWPPRLGIVSKLVDGAHLNRSLRCNPGRKPPRGGYTPLAFAEGWVMGALQG